MKIQALALVVYQAVVYFYDLESALAVAVILVPQMIVDFRSMPSGTQVETDLCIVGTGPAGLALAREFVGTATDVVVLESGGLGFESASEQLNDGESIGLAQVGFRHGRRRQFGGATNIWGAICVELDPSDFSRRPWIADSGWPIAAADVAPFYDRARRLFGLTRSQFGETQWRAFGMEAAAFDARDVRFSVCATAPIADLGKAYRGELRAAANLRVLLHATVTNLRTNSAGSAMEGVEFRSPDGKLGSVKARAFVLCCGGIENARLLLVSRDAQPRGLGNGEDLVGRYLADHTFSLTARIAPLPGRNLLPFRSLRRAGSSFRPRLALSAERQAGAGVLNCMAQVHFEPPASGGFAAAHRLRRAVRFRRRPAELGRDLARVLRSPAELTALAFERYVYGRHPADQRQQPWLECVAEQAPNPHSRVTLSGRRDRFGLPLPVVDWRTAQIERRTIAHMTEVVGRELRRLAIATVEPEPWLAGGAEDAWQTRLVEGYHHMGTTRMAASPRSGVVDAHGRVHDVGGLYVAGSSVFPSAGYANGTLTIVALAIRLADHLKHRVLHSRPAVAEESDPAASVPVVVCGGGESGRLGVAPPRDAS